MTNRLEHRTWASIPDGPLVLVPIGSTERHGPHLPLDTDTVIATAVARGIADRIRLAPLRACVLVAPAVPYGVGGQHPSLPGAVSIGHHALRVMLIELVRSLSPWAGPVVFVNGHGGNVPALERAVAQMIAEHRNADWVPCREPGGDAPGGRAETSIMLHLRPAEVDLSLTVPGISTDAYGTATAANAADGRVLLDEMVTRAYFRIAILDVDADAGA